MPSGFPLCVSLVSTWGTYKCMKTWFPAAYQCLRTTYSKDRCEVQLFINWSRQSFLLHAVLLFPLLRAMSLDVLPLSHNWGGVFQRESDINTHHLLSIDSKGSCAWNRETGAVSQQGSRRFWSWSEYHNLMIYLYDEKHAHFSQLAYYT